MSSQSVSVWLYVIGLITFAGTICVESNSPITQRIEDIEVRQDDGRRYRLPNDTVPETYDITLWTRIDRADFSFEGNVQIGILAVEATQRITLHQRQLIIANAKLYTTTNPTQEINVDSFDYDPVLEFLQIHVTQGLTAGTRYTLSIDYTGTLREDNYGFYRSSYRNNDGVQIWQATTQFESTDARHGFPCYDEPQLRATFRTTIIHGSSYTALSNMPVSEGYPIVNTDGTTTTRFDPTPAMSTYLNVFFVSDFVSRASSAGIVPHRVFARESAINQTGLILDAGVLILDAIGTYLGVNYSLPKMDQVGVPDFGPGAMENWGLVTYRETRFLYEETVSDYTMKTALITIVAHELGHQWFGNLVGPRWWDVIWLNEGFANLFGFIGADEVYPEWRIMEYYVVNVLQNVFQSDALEQTRPMTNYIESPEAISAAFDNIAYEKSGCVLRMFSHALSKPTFVKGLKIYLTEKAYSAAGEEDLFNALAAAVQEDQIQLPTNFPAIMASWTNQKGFPVVTVERNYAGNSVTLSQKRYLSNSSAADNGERWWIPYNIATQSAANFDDTTATHWMSANAATESVTVAGLKESDWLILNKKETGFYRVKYDIKNYGLIANALETGSINQIDVLSRAQLLDDAFNFAQTNQLEYSVFLDLTKFLRKDIDYIPWAAASTGFRYIDRLFAGHANHAVFRDYVRRLIETMYDGVKINDVASEPHIRKYARSLVLNLACEMGSAVCRSEALAKLRLLGPADEFPVNTRPELYCGALRASVSADFDKVWQRLLSSSDTSYRNMLISALACTTSTELLSAYLNTSLATTNPYSNVTYRPDELVRVFNAVYQSGPAGLQLAIPFLTANANAASMAFGSNNLVTIYKNMAQRISDHTLHHQFSELTTALGSVISADIAKDADNEIMYNVDWVEKHGAIIDTWLKENHSSGASSLMLSSLLSIGVLLSIIRYF